MPRRSGDWGDLERELAEMEEVFDARADDGDDERVEPEDES